MFFFHTLMIKKNLLTHESFFSEFFSFAGLKALYKKGSGSSFRGKLYAAFFFLLLSDCMNCHNNQFYFNFQKFSVKTNEPEYCRHII